MECDLLKRILRMDRKEILDYISFRCGQENIAVNPELYGKDICMLELFDYIIEHFHPEWKILSSNYRSKTPKAPFWKETMGQMQKV